MSVNELLESLQQRLQTATSGIVAKHTVAGIFATLRKSSVNEGVRTVVISSCLSNPNKVVVQEAAVQLLSLTNSGGLPTIEAAELLLSAMTTAGPLRAAPLADALCKLVVAAASGGNPRSCSWGPAAPIPGPPPLRRGRWTSHPLVAALLANPAAATQLLSSSVAALSAAAAAAAEEEGDRDSTGGSGIGGGCPDSGAAHLARIWSSLEPFFSFVLLQRHPPSSADRAAGGGVLSGGGSSQLSSVALSAWLHGQLVRLACGGPYGAPPSLRLLLLEFLTGHLILGPRAAEVDRMHAVQSTTDLLDVLEAVLHDIRETAAPEAEADVELVVQPIASALLQLAFEVMMGLGGGGAQEVVAALLRLQSLSPTVLQEYLAALSLLTLNAYGKELQGLYLILHKALQVIPSPERQHHHDHTSLPPPTQQQQEVISSPARRAAANAALSLQPLLAAVAFGTSAPSGAAPASAWPTHLATALQRLMGDDSNAEAASGSNISSSQSSGPVHGDLCLQRQCQQLLLSLWADTTAPAQAKQAQASNGGPAPPLLPCDLPRWLNSLELALRQRRRAGKAAKAVAEQLTLTTKISDVVAEVALGASDAHPAVSCLLAALLVHPDPWVGAAAATAARELVLLLPAAALPLLPLVMFQLRRGSSASAGATVAISSAQLALLQLLPVMATDSAVAPYVLRVLQPMLQPDSPQSLRCLALKLVCDTWLISGRGWPRVEAALNGLVIPGAKEPPLTLRVTRAALLRAVCDRDPGRGLELVPALQQAICDPSCPPAAALGLEALGVLAEEDVLDFYAAYRVVHRWHPRLPTDPLVGSRWVALLAHGSLDAEAYSDRVMAVLELLWSAASHPNPEVRAAAFEAIRSYPPDLLERLQVLRPLSQYTAPLLNETNPRVSGAARGLAAVALQFEHDNRRRLVLTQPALDVAHQPGAAAVDGRGGGSSGSKGAAFAAAATGREARALRGRLMGRIPKMLLAGITSGRPLGGGAATVATTTGTGSLHPGAALFCYSRPPPPPLPQGATAAAVAAAAKRAVTEAREAYGARMRDALRRLTWRGHWHARLAVQAWTEFVRHWTYDTGLTVAAVAAALVKEWDGTAAAATAAASTAAPAAVLEGVGLAVGALCTTAVGLSEADVSSLTTRLLQQAQSGRSSSISRSSLVGLGLAATRLHPTDWATRQQVLSELRVQLLAGSTAVVRSAAATALAVLAGSMAADPAIYIRAGGHDGDGSGGGDGVHSRELSAVAEALSYLIASLGAHCPPLAAALAALAASGMPLGWPSPKDRATSYGTAPRRLKDEVDVQDVIPGTAVAVASLLCDVNRAHGLPAAALPDLLAALVKVAADAGGGWDDGGAAAIAAVVAALEAVAVLAPEVMRYQQMQPAELRFVLETARSLTGSCLAGEGAQAHGEDAEGPVPLTSTTSIEGSPVITTTTTTIMITTTTTTTFADATAVAAAADGRIRGAAAYCLACVAVAALRHGLITSELVSELKLFPLTPPAMAVASRKAATVRDVGEAALLALVSELSVQAAPAAAVAKGRHVAAARTGAVAGLAAVLLPPPASLVDALAPIPAGSISLGLLAQPEHLVPAKAAVRSLERLATEDADPWVSAAAAFHLAAVSAAVEVAEEGGDDTAGLLASSTVAVMGGSGASGGGGCSGQEGRGGGADAGGGGGSGHAGPKPLSQYPPDGAIRQIATALLDGARPSASAPPLPLLCLTNSLLALAEGPALPAAEWSSTCRSFIYKASFAVAAPQTAADGMRLLAATLLLALAHGSVPSLGLGSLLEELVLPTRFAALPAAVQSLMLARLPALLRSLAAKRAAAVVQSLPGLLIASSLTSPSSSAGSRGSGCKSDGDSGPGDGDDGSFPWSSAAGLDEPALQILWLQRLRKSLAVADARAGCGSEAASSLAAHCWLGLLGVCRGWQAKDAFLTNRDITQAAHTAIVALAAQLPPLPPLQAGEAMQLMAWATASQGSTTAGAGGGGAGGRCATAAATAAAAAAAVSVGNGDDWDTCGPFGRPIALATREAVGRMQLFIRGGGGGGRCTAAAAAARAGVTLWSLATWCLRCLRPDFLITQILTDGTASGSPEAASAAVSPRGGTLSAQALAMLQLRCVLAASGHVSYRELMPVRTAVVAETVVVAAAGHSLGNPLLVPLALAMAGTPQAFQVQVLLQTLDSACTAAQTLPFLELAAALVATFLGAAVSNGDCGAATAVDMCVVLTSQRAALDCLSYTLPRLLSRPPWSASCEAVAQALLAVARELLQPRGGVGRGVNGREEAVSPLGVVLTCLWALRDALPVYTYDQLHSTVGWRQLARCADAVGVK